MSTILDDDRKSMGVLLGLASNIAQRYFQEQYDLAPGRYVASIPAASLTEKGMGGEAVLRYFEKELAPLMTNSAGPRYFGFVTGGSTPASVAGDWLASSFDQNACGSNDSAAPLIEHQTIDLIRQLIGIDPSFFGSFVTGATISNMVGLSLGRQWAGEQLGVDVSSEGLSAIGPIRVYSGTPHSSILKSLSMNGMGRNAIQYVRVQSNREAIDVNALEEQLALSPQPAIVVANAGTVNTVDFDDLVAIASLKKKYKFWLHVDAAFGGFAGASPSYKHLITGMNEADSITIDAHKWLNVPYDAAMQFTRHKDLQLKVFQNSAAYLSDADKTHDFFHYTPENSRRSRALPSWFSLMSYGREGHRSIVEKCCQLAQEFGRQVESGNNFRLLSPVRMNVVCFTFTEATSMEEVRAFLNSVRDDGRAFFTPTLYKNVPAIRAAFSNWLTREEDVSTAVSALNEVRQKTKSPESREPALSAGKP